MRAADLIAALAKLPEDAEVRMEDWSENYSRPYPVEVVYVSSDGAVILGVSYDRKLPGGEHFK